MQQVGRMVQIGALIFRNNFLQPRSNFRGITGKYAGAQLFELIRQDFPRQGRVADAFYFRMRGGQQLFTFRADFLGYFFALSQPGKFDACFFFA